jgi:hypothetical protein
LVEALHPSFGQLHCRRHGGEGQEQGDELGDRHWLRGGWRFWMMVYVEDEMFSGALFIVLLSNTLNILSVRV